MAFPPSIRLAASALRELGPRSLALYGMYRLGLYSGYLRWRTKAARFTRSASPWASSPRPLLPLPDRQTLSQVLDQTGLDRLFRQAEGILSGSVSLFGGEPGPLQLVPQGPLSHWTAYARGQASWGAEDVKFVWEPGRFGWALTLAQAYHLSQETRYAQAFWSHTEAFLDANPPNMGPQWSSAQEVALRLISLTIAFQAFAASPESTPECTARLGEALAAHAARIPPTLAYARAQNNNHLLTEALGLYTASLALPDHPQASHWRKAGWKWYNHAIQNQISPDGTYIQHSANYHRLVLQTGLWAAMLARGEGTDLPHTTRERLAAATNWALSLVDPETGSLPNLGPNDGAYIIPLTACPFHDHRPVLQAAALAFLGERPFPPGHWDDMSSWLVPYPVSEISGFHRSTARSVLRSADSWAYLRVAHFKSRPGHADQLHLDLWWRGMNVAQDPGTYLYNAPPPWNNTLAGTSVHNTLSIDGLDQMRRAGRFLWLEWAQGDVVDNPEAEEGEQMCVVARHDGYRRLGLVHQRKVTVYPDNRWRVEDYVMPHLQDPKRGRDGRHSVRLHWQLPDWPWELEGAALRLRSPFGWVLLKVGAPNTDLDASGSLRIQLSRAGKLLAGSGPVSPVSGWTSPTYGCKFPALSFAVEASSRLPLVLISEWIFPVIV